MNPVAVAAFGGAATGAGVLCWCVNCVPPGYH